MVMLSESIQSLNMPVNFDNMPCRREGVGRAERTHVYSHATGGVHCGRAIIRYGACCGLVVVCIVILGCACFDTKTVSRSPGRTQSTKD